jgi:hypothetical protein
VQVTSNVLFTAAADGDAPLSFQWYFNTTNAITNATNLNCTVSNAQISNSGNYTFVATNTYGAATSSVAGLTVLSNSVDFLAYDFFAYPSGTSLAGQTPPGMPFPWTNNNSSASGTMTTNDQLMVPGLAASTGNAYTWGNSASSMRLPIGTNVSGTLYFAFAFRMDNRGNPPTATTSETMAGFTFGTGTTFASKINVVTNGGNTYQIGLYKAGGTSVGALAPNLLNPGDTVFIVSRYSFNINGGTDDTCDLWINPNPSTFGAANPPPPTVGPIGAGATDLAQLDRFFFRRSNGWPLRSTADELRIGYTWAQVTPPFVFPPPTLTVAVDNGTNVVVGWPTNYTDYILQGSTNIAPPAWSSVTNAAVVNGTNYNVTIRTSNNTRFFRLIK